MSLNILYFPHELLLYALRAPPIPLTRCHNRII